MLRNIRSIIIVIMNEWYQRFCGKLNSNKSKKVLNEKEPIKWNDVMWIPNWRSVFKRGLWFSIAESWVCCVLFSECFLFCFVCFVLICIGFTFFIIIKFNVARRSAFPSETAEWAFWSFTRTTTNFQWTTTTRCSWRWSQCRWCCTSRIKSTHWLNINFVFVFFAFVNVMRLCTYF